MEKRDHLHIQSGLERQRISSNAPTIEWKLKEYTKNANARTSTKLPQPSTADERFRTYIDGQVDALSRLSVDSILNRMSGAQHIIAANSH